MDKKYKMRTFGFGRYWIKSRIILKLRKVFMPSARKIMRPILIWLYQYYNDFELYTQEKIRRLFYDLECDVYGNPPNWPDTKIFPIW